MSKPWKPVLLLSDTEESSKAHLLLASSEIEIKFDTIGNEDMSAPPILQFSNGHRVVGLESIKNWLECGSNCK